MCQVYFRFRFVKVQKLSLDWFLRILYNLYIDEKETEMTDNEFFKLDQELWFTEYVESELSKKVSDTDTQIENFFLDVPFWSVYNRILNGAETKHKGHMMTDKTVNYTPEQTAQLVQAYTEGQSVENLAMQLGRSTRSIVAKLSREGVYKAKSKTSGVARVKKADLVDEIANRCGVAPEIFESLEKANHEVLEQIAYNLRWLLRLGVKKY